MGRVRINIEGLKAYIGDDIDRACYFVGVFVRAAVEQGWTEGDIDRVLKPVTARRAYEQLLPHIEPAASHEQSYHRAHREEDYLEGCRRLADDPNVKYKPFRWALRPFFDVIEQGRTQGWFSRPRLTIEPQERRQEPSEGQIRPMAEKRERPAHRSHDPKSALEQDQVNSRKRTITNDPGNDP